MRSSPAVDWRAARAAAAEAIQLAQDFVRPICCPRHGGRPQYSLGNGPDGAAQPHAHVMLSLRESPARVRKKQRTWNDRGVLRGWREDWAALVNERLAEAGRDIRIDHGPTRPGD